MSTCPPVHPIKVLSPLCIQRIHPCTLTRPVITRKVFIASTGFIPSPCKSLWLHALFTSSGFTNSPDTACHHTSVLSISYGFIPSSWEGPSPHILSTSKGFPSSPWQGVSSHVKSSLQLLDSLLRLKKVHHIHAFDVHWPNLFSLTKHVITCKVLLTATGITPSTRNSPDVILCG